MLRWIGVLVLAAGTAGCSSLAGWSATETDLLQAAYVVPDRFPSPPPLYCYRTLAKVDCYAWPLPGEGNRLVGAYAY